MARATVAVRSATRREADAYAVLRRRLLAFSDHPTVANFHRYREASRSLDEIRSGTTAEYAPTLLEREVAIPGG